MLYKIRCNPIHPLYDALSVLYVPVPFYTRGSGRTSLYLGAYSLYNLDEPQDLYSPLSVPANDFADPVFYGVGLAVFNSSANAFSLA